MKWFTRLGIVAFMAVAAMWVLWPAPPTRTTTQAGTTPQTFNTSETATTAGTAGTPPTRITPETRATEQTSPPGPVLLRYEVRGLGNSSDLEQFAAAAAETYADGRGWNDSGAVNFERVASTADFTLWLSADERMESFGGACGPTWSCRSDDNVVINETRWLEASPMWNEAAGTLTEYRHMVVNHETGHWLGFGHTTCSTPDALAAVMQQQSIGLQGCATNPWPLPAELRTAARRR